MSRLSDELIERLAKQKAPHAYSHEVHAMAQEILERRAAEKAPPQQQAGAAGWTPGLFP